MLEAAQNLAARMKALQEVVSRNTGAGALDPDALAWLLESFVLVEKAPVLAPEEAVQLGAIPASAAWLFSTFIQAVGFREGPALSRFTADHGAGLVLDPQKELPAAILRDAGFLRLEMVDELLAGLMAEGWDNEALAHAREKLQGLW